MRDTYRVFYPEDIYKLFKTGIFQFKLTKCVSEGISGECLAQKIFEKFLTQGIF